ncbi:CPBP family glutamic-type intramembrane protease [Salmonirosea aquatica]|uniref:CPBP family intramembrane metalloprotease n=1 Tax=Salmonirosea aquatica TaxID=2654236 RepID=A0A7C9BDZ7_9BACT|nr:CPBP family intramembrane metalloprotease [Cytophagaceae bacterium SJW1-29]
MLQVDSMDENSTTIQFILRDFWGFLIRPGYPEHTYSFSLLIAFKLFIGFFIIRVLGIILEMNGFHPLVLYFTGHELQKQQHPDFGIIPLLIGALLSAPLLEETAYRWGLQFSPVRTAVSLGLIVFYWLPYGGTYSTTITRVLAAPGFYLMVGMAVVTGLTTYALLRIPYFEHKVGHWWKRNFGWVFYVSSLSFGLMHIFNVREINPTVVSLAFLITFQQILLGLFNGYVRMRFGFAQAIVQHALFNLVPVVIQLSQA